MKCSNIENKLINFIEGNIIGEEFSIIQNHIDSCENCQKEVEEMKLFLGLLDADVQEIPSDSLKMNFEAFLNEEKKQTKVIKLHTKNNWKSHLRIAASILVVLSAFLVGKHQSNIEDLSFAKKQRSKEKKQVLALLENQSASKRILAVSNAEKFSKTDTKIIDALINKLFNDKNVNVRLA